MTNASQHYHGVSDGTGGVRLVPRKGSPMEKAVRRLYGVSFTDTPIPLEPMNNLGIPYKARAKRPSEDSRRRARDNGDPPPLDPDLRQLARNAGSSNMVEEVYAEQAKRDAKRGFDATGCDCTQDQGPSPTRAVQAGTKAINRVSEFGEEFNRDSRGRRRARDQQLPDPDQMDPDEHQEPDGDETIIGTLDPPPDGFRYALVESDGDTIAVILQPDLGERDDPDLNTNDRMWKHRVSDGVDPVTKRQNAVNRAFWMKDQAESTLIRHKPGPGNKLVLGADPTSLAAMISFWSSGFLRMTSMHEQGGAEDFDAADTEEMGAASWLPQPEKDDPQQLQQPTPTFRDRRMPEAVTIRSMNQQAKAFWAKR